MPSMSETLDDTSEAMYRTTIWHVPRVSFLVGEDLEVGGGGTFKYILEYDATFVGGFSHDLCTFQSGALLV